MYKHGPTIAELLCEEILARQDPEDYEEIVTEYIEEQRKAYYHEWLEFMHEFYHSV